MPEQQMSPDAKRALAQTERLARRLERRLPKVKRYEDYYRGRHPLAYATQEWSEDHAKRFEKFSDNWCGVVGSAPGERTQLNGFRLDDSRDKPSRKERMLAEDWKQNELDAQASQGFLMSTIAKRSATLVWGDENDEPVVTWERPDQVIVDYDPERPFVSRRSLKAWRDDEREYATLYTPDVVWKWFRPGVRVRDGRTESGLFVPDMLGGGWQPRPVKDSGDDTWPIKNPLGIDPMVEWQNRPMLGGRPLSDIAGAMAMQDAVNLLWAYLFAAADYASMPARVVMGLQRPMMPILDANGQKIGEQPVELEALAKGRLLWLTGQGGDIKQWDAAKLDVFTAVINVAVKHIASQTRTPIHYIVGDLGNVNGETLTATETPLAMKVRESHKYYTPSARGLYERMALVRGDTKLAKACRSGIAKWANPETRSDAQTADAAVKDRSVGFAFATVLRERYGYTQPQIDQALAERQAEDSAAITAGVPDIFRSGLQGAQNPPDPTAAPVKA